MSEGQEAAATSEERGQNKKTRLCSCCVSLWFRLSKYPSTLFVSILLFAALTATGIVLCKLSFDSQEQTARDEALKIGEESGDMISRVLDLAILPLFTMAQFATELQIFNDLPDKIGLANETGSLPFLTNEDGSFNSNRNITGVCDEPELMERYAQIVSTIQRNLKLEGVFRNIQLLPNGVICLSHGDIELRAGQDTLNDPVYRTGARATLMQDDIVLVGPLILDYACPTCGLHIVARYPVRSDSHQIELDGEIYNRWGVTSAIFNWEALLEQSKIHEHTKARGFEFQLTRTDEKYNVETFTYDEAVTVLTESEGYGSKTRVVGRTFQTADDVWEIKIQYDNPSNTAVFIAVSVLGPFLLAVLVYIVLVQKQIQTTLRGTSMAQEAKVAIERNMTAYFAHELRNPLGAIDSALSSMPDDLSSEAQELVAGMQLCSSFMSSIMNNLLDVRKIEEGMMVLRSDPLSLESLVQDVRKMTLPAVRPGVKLNVLVETKNQDCVLGDIHRLQQILINLVTNAIKYTVSGSITLAVGWEGDLVRLECRDTGPGIPKEEQKNLFERFVMRGGAPGSGLGMAIAKQIVDLMKGSVCFESDPTVKPGTNCVVRLPLKTCDEPQCAPSLEPEDDKPIEKSFSILIVDDIKMNRLMLKKRILKGIAPHCAISEAATGEAALSICEMENFDVIVMDQYMEEAGGVLVGTDVITTMRRSNVDAFIIGCSGNDLEAPFLSAGADLVWGKPLPSNSVIKQQLRDALGMRASV